MKEESLERTHDAFGGFVLCPHCGSLSIGSSPVLDALVLLKKVKDLSDCDRDKM
jgi:hypothetical protein